jgi:hypothetical protein
MRQLPSAQRNDTWRSASVHARGPDRLGLERQVNGPLRAGFEFVIVLNVHNVDYFAIRPRYGWASLHPAFRRHCSMDALQNTPCN